MAVNINRLRQFNQDTALSGNGQAILIDALVKQYLLTAPLSGGNLLLSLPAPIDSFAPAAGTTLLKPEEAQAAPDSPSTVADVSADPVVADSVDNPPAKASALSDSAPSDTSHSAVALDSSTTSDSSISVSSSSSSSSDGDTIGLQQYKAEAQGLGKYASPLTLDLNGDGVKTSTSQVQYDINGDGTQDTISDISGDDGVLTVDTNGNGNSGENGKELFGDNTDLSAFGIHGKFKDGFDALKALADNAKQRGLINGDDTLDANELKTMEKTYGLKIKQGGLNHQASSLAQAGISSINLATGQKVRTHNFDQQGNDVVSQAGAAFTRNDGSQGSYSDIFFRTE